MILDYEEEIISNKLYTIFFALISGISIAIKITSVFYILPIYLYLLISNRKKIKMSFFLLTSIFIISPSLIYLIDNYVQTGSILFPYYNSIFKSEFFEYYNWIDERFTINGIVNKLIWPTIIGFKYGKYGDDFEYADIVMGISYILFVISLIISVIKKRIDKITILQLLTVSFYIFWIVVMKGYHRYGVFVIIMATLLVLSRIINIIDKKNITIKNSIKNVLILYFPFLIAMCGFSFMYRFDYNNFRYMFKDTDSEKYKISIDGVWGAPEDTSAYVSLVREENTPIYNLHREYFEDSEKALAMWEDKINNNKIYTIIAYYGGRLEDNEVYKLIKNDGFEIKDIIKEYTASEIPYINANSTWILVELEREK